MLKQQHAATPQPLGLMCRYGGMYVDLDTESLKPMQPLLEGHHVLLAAIGRDSTHEHSINNGFMASRPAEDFWMFYLQGIVVLFTDKSALVRAAEWLCGLAWQLNRRSRCGQRQFCILTMHVACGQRSALLASFATLVCSGLLQNGHALLDRLASLLMSCHSSGPAISPPQCMPFQHGQG